MRAYRQAQIVVTKRAKREATSYNSHLSCCF
jgi:hypothetical protein